MSNAITTIQFHNDTLTVFEDVGRHFVAMKPIVENLGLQWEAQRKRIQRHPVLSKGASIMEVPSASGNQLTLMLPINLLNGWLFGIDTNRVKAHLQERLIQYQTECYDVLSNHFLGKANEQAATISLAQQQTIKELAAVVNAATGQSFGEIYSRLHNRFRVPRYQELHPSQFVEACEYLQSKPDGNMMAKLVMDLFGRPRILMSIDHNGQTTAQLLRDDDMVIPYSSIPARIESGDIPANVVKAIASQALNRMTGGQLAVI